MTNFDPALPVNYGGTGRTDGKAQALVNARTVQFSGSATGSFNYDGSGNSSCVLTLANSGVVASTYGSSLKIPTITVNQQGLITGVSEKEVTKTNLGLDKFTQNPNLNTAVGAPNVDAAIIITDAGWGVYRNSSVTNFDPALPVNYGGTGRTDGKAQALATPRKIELSGAVFGSASFDGSGNIVINTTYNSARNLNENGYIIHPDGRVEQWGYIAGGVDEQIYTVNFPITFPNQCSNIQVSRMRKYGTVAVADADGGALVLEGTITRSSFVVDHQRFNSNSIGSLGGTMWRAIGY